MASRDRLFLGCILVTALIHGLIYVFLMPPWQHYDEPTHFEYAWLIASAGRIPQAGETIPEQRRAIAISMREHDFFRDMAFKPPLEEEGKPIWLGLSQIGNLPLYYRIAALPVGWLENWGVEVQLYSARLVSWVFFVLSVLACWGVVAVITPAGHFLRLLVPLSLALLPGYVDVMTAVNNDSAAVCLAGLFLWGAVYLVRYGFSFFPFAGMLTAAVLAFWSKETAYPIYVLFLLGIFLWVFRGRARTAAWILVAVSPILAGLLLVHFDDAANWYRVTLQKEPTRAASARAVLGEHVFQLNVLAERAPDWFSVGIFQPVPKDTFRQDKENVYTFGVWAWSAAPQARTRLSLGFGFTKFGQVFDLNSDPTFFAITGTMTAAQSYPFRMMLFPEIADQGALLNPTQTLVYYDAIVLAEGIYPFDRPPVFDNADGMTGSWGGEPFINLARNPSAERAGIRVSSGLDRVFSRFWPEQTQASLLLASILDGPGSNPYYLGAAKQMLLTFWGRFGWGHVPLSGPPVVYKFLALSTVVSLLATLTWLLRAGMQAARLKQPEGMVSICLFLAAALLPWIIAILRAPIYLGLELLYLPVARYAYAAIIPTILALNLGFYMLWDALDHKLAERNWQIWLPMKEGWLLKATLGIGMPLLFSIYSAASILAYYQR